MIVVVVVVVVTVIFLLSIILLCYNFFTFYYVTIIINLLSLLLFSYVFSKYEIISLSTCCIIALEVEAWTSPGNKAQGQSHRNLAPSRKKPKNKPPALRQREVESMARVQLFSVLLLLAQSSENKRETAEKIVHSTVYENTTYFANLSF